MIYFLFSGKHLRIGNGCAEKVTVHDATFRHSDLVFIRGVIVVMDRIHIYTLKDQ